MPKIIGGSLAEHREKVRGKLFAALSDLMERSGFDAVSLAEIAQQAGVGRTSVYNHFPDKESLLIGFIEHETERFLDDLRQALVQVQDPQEQLRVYVREQINLRRSYHLAPAALRAVVSRHTLTRLRDHVVLVESMLHEILAAGIDSGRLPAQDLDSVVPLINSCLSARAVPESGPERQRAIIATEAFVMRAVGVPEQAVAADRIPVEV
ncbi:TetR/AcrR family transcriptional regulator [Pseudactinotalea sp. Z1748]|uniref:TetR/AcrR family transcriptional regulator n=1 Tax=Pseudactinotalea sp. Z1748 TaxID=3413027 RepID=UPI003C79DB36